MESQPFKEGEIMFEYSKKSQVIWQSKILEQNGDWSN
jgi:hypothetical protein